MKRKILLQLVLPLLGLVMIFSLLAFTPSRSGQQPPLLEMSVIVREPDGDSLSAVRQGMEQAAVDLNVELRFLSPSVANDAHEQRQLLLREVEAGASAIILFPGDRDILADAVQEAAGKAALVTMETEMRQQGAHQCICVDNAALGEALGQAALNGVESGGTVLLLDSAAGDNGVRARLEAAAALLRSEGRQVRLCPMASAADLTDALASTSVNAVVAFEASALETAAALAQSAGQFPLLYGFGSTPSIAAGLEQSNITAIVAQNQFAAGYLAVENAAALARHQATTPLDPLPFTLIRLESMYLPENQKLLFPVT